MQINVRYDRLYESVGKSGGLKKIIWTSRGDKLFTGDLWYKQTAIK